MSFPWGVAEFHQFHLTSLSELLCHGAREYIFGTSGHSWECYLWPWDKTTLLGSGNKGSQRRHRLKDRNQERVATLQPVYYFCLPTPRLTYFTLRRRKNGTFIWFAFVFLNQGHLRWSFQKENLSSKHVKYLACDIRKSQILFMRSLQVYNEETICDTNSFNHFLFY